MRLQHAAARESRAQPALLCCADLGSLRRTALQPAVDRVTHVQCRRAELGRRRTTHISACRNAWGGDLGTAATWTTRCQSKQLQVQAACNTEMNDMQHTRWREIAGRGRATHCDAWLALPAARRHAGAINKPTHSCSCCSTKKRSVSNVSSECTRFNSANLCRECEGVCARTVAVCASVHAVQGGRVLALQIDKSDKDKLATTRSGSHVPSALQCAAECDALSCATELNAIDSDSLSTVTRSGRRPHRLP